MNWRIWRRFDYVLLALVTLLIGYGIVMIYSATQSTTDLQLLWRTQLIRAGIGVAAMLVLSAIDYRYYKELSRLFYVIILLINI